MRDQNGLRNDHESWYKYRSIDQIQGFTFHCQVHLNVSCSLSIPYSAKVIKPVISQKTLTFKYSVGKQFLPVIKLVPLKTRNNLKSLDKTRGHENLEETKCWEKNLTSNANFNFWSKFW